MKPESMELMIRLEAARLLADEQGDASLQWTVADDYSASVIASLRRYRYIEESPTKAGFFRITQSGRMEMKTFNLPEQSTAQSMQIVAVAAPNPPPIVAAEEECDACPNCIYREALDILAARLPEVPDLLDSLKKINRLAH